MSESISSSEEIEVKEVTHAIVKFRVDYENVGQSVQAFEIEAIVEISNNKPQSRTEFDKNKLYTLVWNDKKNPNSFIVPVQIYKLACGKDELQGLLAKRPTFSVLSPTVVAEYNKERDKSYLEKQLPAGSQNEEEIEKQTPEKEPTKDLSKVLDKRMQILMSSNDLCLPSNMTAVHINVNQLLAKKDAQISNLTHERDQLKEQLIASETKVKVITDLYNKLLDSLSKQNQTLSTARKQLFLSSTPTRQADHFGYDENQDTYEMSLPHVPLNETQEILVSPLLQNDEFVHKSSQSKSLDNDSDLVKNCKNSATVHQRKQCQTHNFKDVQENDDKQKESIKVKYLNSPSHKRISKKRKANKQKSKKRKKADSDEDYESENYKNYKEKNPRKTFVEDVTS